ncbi:hypothetical protein I302_107594 [Kwoniella bestiolae CBS 10118]|uniref:Uncharacterized protein n=1 Tax=Kwoniella bestiolae CBS 10118 TaxID=1296100 RepID=A0A1B9FY33_9TREE|nr:hypothetical protein I302_06666 [Kwoniella bestiolae CBS 10118]OCF23683.1 hypothetical protein I302_06666 [Kwoniella bestiolae CBS 10118]
MPVQINYTSGSLNRAKRARSCKNRTKKTRRNVFGKPKPNPVLLEVLENRSANPFGPISRSARGMDEQTRQNVVWEPWWTRRGDKRNESGRSSPDRENGRRPGEGGLKSVQVTERRLYSEQANIETVVSTDAHPGTESIETAQNRG